MAVCLIKHSSMTPINDEVKGGLMNGPSIVNRKEQRRGNQAMLVRLVQSEMSRNEWCDNKTNKEINIFLKDCWNRKTGSKENVK